MILAPISDFRLQTLFRYITPTHICMTGDTEVSSLTCHRRRVTPAGVSWDWADRAQCLERGERVNMSSE